MALFTRRLNRKCLKTKSRKVYPRSSIKTLFQKKVSSSKCQSKDDQNLHEISHQINSVKQAKGQTQKHFLYHEERQAMSMDSDTGSVTEGISVHEKQEPSAEGISQCKSFESSLSDQDIYQLCVDEWLGLKKGMTSRGKTGECKRPNQLEEMRVSRCASAAVIEGKPIKNKGVNRKTNLKEKKQKKPGSLSLFQRARSFRRVLTGRSKTSKAARVQFKVADATSEDEGPTDLQVISPPTPSPGQCSDDSDSPQCSSDVEVAASLSSEEKSSSESSCDESEIDLNHSPPRASKVFIDKGNSSSQRKSPAMLKSSQRTESFKGKEDVVNDTVLSSLEANFVTLQESFDGNVSIPIQIAIKGNSCLGSSVPEILRDASEVSVPAKEKLQNIKSKHDLRDEQSECVDIQRDLTLPPPPEELSVSTAPGRSSICESTQNEPLTIEADQLSETDVNKTLENEDKNVIEIDQSADPEKLPDNIHDVFPLECSATPIIKCKDTLASFPVERTHHILVPKEKLILSNCVAQALLSIESGAKICFRLMHLWKREPKGIIDSEDITDKLEGLLCHAHDILNVVIEVLAYFDRRHILILDEEEVQFLWLFHDTMVFVLQLYRHLQKMKSESVFEPKLVSLIMFCSSVLSPLNKLNFESWTSAMLELCLIRDTMVGKLSMPDVCECRRYLQMSSARPCAQCNVIKLCQEYELSLNSRNREEHSVPSAATGNLSSISFQQFLPKVAWFFRDLNNQSNEEISKRFITHKQAKFACHPDGGLYPCRVHRTVLVCSCFREKVLHGTQLAVNEQEKNGMIPALDNSDKENHLSLQTINSSVESPSCTLERSQILTNQATPIATRLQQKESANAMEVCTEGSNLPGSPCTAKEGHQQITESKSDAPVCGESNNSTHGNISISPGNTAVISQGEIDGSHLSEDDFTLHYVESPVKGDTASSSSTENPVPKNHHTDHHEINQINYKTFWKTDHNTSKPREEHALMQQNSLLLKGKDAFSDSDSKSTVELESEENDHPAVLTERLGLGAQGNSKKSSCGFSSTPVPLVETKSPSSLSSSPYQEAFKKWVDTKDVSLSGASDDMHDWNKILDDVDETPYFIKGNPGTCQQKLFEDKNSVDGSTEKNMDVDQDSSVPDTILISNSDASEGDVDRIESLSLCVEKGSDECVFNSSSDTVDVVSQSMKSPAICKRLSVGDNVATKEAQLITAQESPRQNESTTCNERKADISVSTGPVLQCDSELNVDSNTINKDRKSGTERSGCSGEVSTEEELIPDTVNECCSIMVHHSSKKKPKDRRVAFSDNISQVYEYDIRRSSSESVDCEKSTRIQLRKPLSLNKSRHNKKTQTDVQENKFRERKSRKRSYGEVGMEIKSAPSLIGEEHVPHCNSESRSREATAVSPTLGEEVQMKEEDQGGDFNGSSTVDNKALSTKSSRRKKQKMGEPADASLNLALTKESNEELGVGCNVLNTANVGDSKTKRKCKNSRSSMEEVKVSLDITDDDKTHIKAKKLKKKEKHEEYVNCPKNRTVSVSSLALRSNGKKNKSGSRKNTSKNSGDDSTDFHFQQKSCQESPLEWSSFLDEVRSKIFNAEEN